MLHKLHEPVPSVDLDMPFGPPSEEYLYRCGVCGEERWVNEAILDVAVGVAQFHGAYTGSMPIIGCPGCNGKIMEYIEQEP
jgi:DNA-directed RNA polymerase subunit RPC12/RpoP